MTPDDRTRGFLSDLPEGTVTFLFTDIEGSTELLKRLREKYADLMAAQRKLLRTVFETHGGQEVDTQGDSFFISFPRATQAASAAVEIQRAVHEHAWPEDVEVRLRIGLHTGEPLTWAEGYVGIDVHRAARIAAVGHGGQVLLSNTTRALIEQDLPDGLNLKDLGEHRLKDLQHPQGISQLTIQGLPSTFPPLTTLNSLPNNLPPQLTNFIGREDEIAKVKSMVSETRLVTLVGPGGTGKTRLSLHVAADLVDRFPHGVWFVELAPVETPSEIIPAMADAMSFRIDAYTNQLDSKHQMMDYLAARDCLLVMDNFEHLVEGADLIVEFMKQAPGLHFLVTSRERLNLSEEWTFDVGGMDYPRNGREAGKGYNALHLFVERAQQVKDDFVLSDEGDTDVIRICRLTEGFPLGLELAASWVSVLPCEVIASEIEKNLDFLASTMKDLPKRHRSLRAVFEHSWQFLTEEERDGYQKLSIFRGGFSRQAAKEVAGVDLKTLAEFVRKSLIRQGVEGRYYVHELLRGYAQERLGQDAGEQQTVQGNHSRFFAQMLHERRRAIDRGQQLLIRDEMRPDINNLKEAAYFACKTWDEVDVRIFLRDFCTFFRAMNYHEGLDVLRQLSRRLEDDGQHPTKEPVRLVISVFECAFEGSLGSTEHESVAAELLPRLRELGYEFELATCLLAMGVYRCLTSDYPEAITFLTESLEIMEPYDDLFAQGTGLSWLGWAYYEMGDIEHGGKIFHEAYDLCKREGSRLGQAYTLSKLGTWADACNEYEQAMQFHQEAYDIFIEFEDAAGQGYVLSRMSLTAWRMGDYEGALEYGQAGLQKFESIGHRWGINTSLCRIGFAEAGLGDAGNAERHFKRALTLAIEDQFPALVGYCLVGLASVRIGFKQYETAIRLLGFAKAQETTPSLYRYFADLEIAKLKEYLSEEEVQDGLNMGAESDLKPLLAAIGF